MEKSRTITEQKNELPVVKIMCMGNNYNSPCTFPLTLKLQTYLRLAGIKYDVVSCVLSSSKLKIPYIEYQGQQIQDTTNIINFLNCEFGTNLNTDLTTQQVEKVHEFQNMIEGNLQWCLEYQRWILDEEIIAKFPLTNWFFRFIFKLILNCKFRPELRQELQKLNLGNFSSEELIGLAENDLVALSQYLGDKPYFMGNKVSEIDATLFGFLGLLLNDMESSPSAKFVTSNLQNLVEYVERMKEIYWPDWKELCSQKPSEKSKYLQEKRRRTPLLL